MPRLSPRQAEAALSPPPRTGPGAAASHSARLQRRRPAGERRHRGGRRGLEAAERPGRGGGESGNKALTPRAAGPGLTPSGACGPRAPAAGGSGLPRRPGHLGGSLTHRVPSNFLLLPLRNDKHVSPGASTPAPATPKSVQQVAARPLTAAGGAGSRAHVGFRGAGVPGRSEEACARRESQPPVPAPSATRPPRSGVQRRKRSALTRGAAHRAARPGLRAAGSRPVRPKFTRGPAHARARRTPRGAHARAGGARPAAASRADAGPVPERGRAAAATAGRAERLSRRPRRPRSSRNSRRASAAGSTPRDPAPSGRAHWPFGQPPPAPQRRRAHGDWAASGWAGPQTAGRASADGGDGAASWWAGPETAGGGATPAEGRGLRRRGRALESRSRAAARPEAAGGREGREGGWPAGGPAVRGAPLATRGPHFPGRTRPAGDLSVTLSKCLRAC